MAQKTVQGNDNLANQIKNRRNELGLTIEEAAMRAGVGTKTWSRYESGGSIRTDKCKGVCKALNWRILPNQDVLDDQNIDNLDIIDKKHEAWSSFLEDEFGEIAAFSFAAGSDILLDSIQEDLNELSSMPIGSHIGQLDCSLLSGILPEQFLMHYDYKFLYRMKCILSNMRTHAKAGIPIIAHSVIEELIIYLCNEEASVLIELSEGINSIKNSDDFYSEDWIFDLFDDMDMVTFLYSKEYLYPNHPYHFSNWFKNQFYSE